LIVGRNPVIVFQIEESTTDNFFASSIRLVIDSKEWLKSITHNSLGSISGCN